MYPDLVYTDRSPALDGVICFLFGAATAVWIIYVCNEKRRVAWREFFSIDTSLSDVAEDKAKKNYENG